MFESEFTAYNLDLVLDLGQDGEVVSVDQNVSGILEGGKQIERFVEPEINLLRWIEFRSCCHAANVLSISDACPNRTVSQGCYNG
ncbi:MAG TPA: hypothetical protein VGG43_02570 [Acidimicrobiales bacterium]